MRHIRLSWRASSSLSVRCFPRNLSSRTWETAFAEVDMLIEGLLVRFPFGSICISARPPRRWTLRSEFVLYVNYVQWVLQQWMTGGLTRMMNHSEPAHKKNGQVCSLSIGAKERDGATSHVIHAEMRRLRLPERRSMCRVEGKSNSTPYTDSHARMTEILPLEIVRASTRHSHHFFPSYLLRSLEAIALKVVDFHNLREPFVPRYSRRNVRLWCTDHLFNFASILRLAGYEITLT